MTTLAKAALLGVIQGLTEFLPVSSTAHLLISERLLGFEDPGGVFTTMIQLGSILAVMWLYREKIVAVVTGLPSQAQARRFAFMILLATLPMIVAGGLLSKFVKDVLYGNFAVIAAAFIIGGIIMLVVERFRPRPDVENVDDIPVGRALAIGMGQVLALIPGVSRSGGTIYAALLLRVDRGAAAEFSFFLAMPTMAAAFAHDAFEARHQLGSARGLEIAVGFVMAFAASFAVVKPFLHYVRRSGFGPFAWYRIVLGAAMLAAMASGWR
ncbi:MAG TPA: undecaprenyl-diphosphate phosphatase [Vicinamibacterales bacterium]|nr:undecaprenyl-diphosphate phosphatase [Vicinamibacterales bacterium]